MSKDETEVIDEPKEEPPVEVILKAGIESICKTCIIKLRKESVPVEFEEAFKLFTEGVVKKIEEIGLGLWALSPEDERVLVTVQRAKADIPPDAELKLVAVPKRSNSAIIDPTTGKGAIKEDKKIVLTK